MPAPPTPARAPALARTSASFLLAVAASLLVACGDDGKVGKQGGPVSAPGSSAPAATLPPAPAVPGEPAGTASPPPSPGATGAAAFDPRVGDWVRWDVKVDGVAGKTTLTWRAKAVEAERVLLVVESVTVDGTGKQTATSSSEQW